MWFSCRQAGVDRISFYNQTTRLGYWGTVLGIGGGLFIGESTITGLLFMGSTTSNLISFQDGGVAVPSTTSTRSAGSKIVIKNGTGTNSTDYAIGFNTNEMWLSNPTAGTTSFYVLATRYARFGSISGNTGLHLGDGTTNGYLGFLGTSANLINYGDGGVAAPNSSTTRSAGYKLIVKTNFGNGLSDYGIGYNTDELWFAGGSTGGTGQVAFYLGFTTPRVTIANGFLNLVSGFAYRINGVQVVGSRIGGWSAPTATQLRAALTNTSTATDVLQTLAALIVDLRTHGLINN
jgi:hypothetical protein